MPSFSVAPAISKVLLPCLLLWNAFNHDIVDAFHSSAAFSRRHRRTLTLKTSTMQREEFELPKQQVRLPSSSSSPVKEDKAWMEQVQSKEIQRVREELIQKFLAHGVTQDVAEIEVDKFLGDKTRSQKFVDMRKDAEKADDLVEGTALLPGVALLFMGLFATVIIEFIVKNR